MACPASARLESREPSKDTAYTREGTIAHAMAEALLRLFLRNGTDPADGFAETLREQWEAGRTMPEELHGVVAHIIDAQDEGLDPWEMLSTVLDHYCRPVWEDFIAARTADPDAVLLVEQQLRLDEFIPGGFGSSDAVVIGGDTLQVFDLKYGKGVRVSAEGNPQMRCYALGALCGPGELYGIATVRMTIVQPRLRWISTDTMTAPALMGWAADVLRPAAVAAYAGEPRFVPGPHCRFCAVAPRCRALAAEAGRAGEHAGEPGLMGNAELAEAYARASAARSWLASAESYMLEHALRGESFPGYKVVEGRSLRSISDPEAAMADLKAAGLDEASYIRPKELRPIGELERLLKRKGFQELLGKYVAKPQGKPTLVPDDDPRPAMGSADEARSDFNTLL